MTNMTDRSGYARVRVTNGDGEGDGCVVEFETPPELGTVTLVNTDGDPVVVRLHADGSGELVRIDPDAP